LQNDENPNRLLTSTSKDHHDPSKLLFKTLLDKATDQTHLVNEVFTFMGIWMQQRVFASADTVRLTFLQIIYIIMDVPEAAKTFIED
jgi:hypothetical protein